MLSSFTFDSQFKIIKQVDFCIALSEVEVYNNCLRYYNKNEEMYEERRSKRDVIMKIII